MLEYKIKYKGKRIAIGLMSGTSQDGIDSAILSIQDYAKKTKFKLLAFNTYDYSKELKDKLHEVTTADKIKLADLSRLNYAIGKDFVNSVKNICDESKIDLKKVDFIGSHGQTLIHLPKNTKFCGEYVKATLQIGEPSIIAKETGILTVADFRPCDIALGGEGAPLTPYTDYIIFSSKTKNRAVINIGGITNISILPKNCSLEDISGYDIGPGNMCIDEAMNILYNKDCDKDGKIAGSGKVNKEMLEHMLDNSFFKSGLKSTGRIDFGADFVKENIEKAKVYGISNEDIIATFTELTAYQISRDVNNLDLDEIIGCGGGYHNPVLMDSIIKNCKNVKYKDIKEFNMTADSREAISFAILANETLCGSPSNVGSKRGILGKIVLP